MGRFINIIESLYGKEEISLEEISEFRDFYNNASNDEKITLDEMEVNIFYKNFLSWKVNEEDNTSPDEINVKRGGDEGNNISSKIEKLHQHSELLNSGAISQDEFDNLKSEILNPNPQSKENLKLLELRELLESETITQEEFENLKKELLSSKAAGIKEKKSYSEKKPNFQKSSNMYQSGINKEQSMSKTTDPFAIVSFAAGLGGFFILPILFVPIGYISSIVSYYRLKDNKKLKGSGLRILGAILTTINILWLMYVYQIGFFGN